jgi:hypothetical protein
VRPHHSADWLAWKIGIPSKRLHEIASGVEEHYHTFVIPKANGKGREINNPDRDLKELQRRVVAEILRPKRLPDYVQGSVVGRSNLTNAEYHVGQPAILRVDIRSFFPHVTNRKVFAIWRDVFGFGTDLSSLLTRLTTLNGHLPQGAPTSSYLANLSLVSVDTTIANKANELNLVYTRFVDDIVLSGVRVREIVSFIVHELSRAVFPCSRDKVVVAGSSKRRAVTGFVVNHPRRATVDRENRDRLRAAVHQYRRRCAEEGMRDLAIERSLNGRIAHVRRCNPGVAERLKAALESVTGNYALPSETQGTPVGNETGLVRA